MKSKHSKSNIFILLCIVSFLFISFILTVNYTNISNNQSSLTSSEEIVSSTHPLEESIQDIPSNKPVQFEGLTLINDNRGVPILCYHSIAEDSSTNGPITLSKSQFREHLQFIKNANYTTLSISQLNDYILNNEPIPEKSVVITFDDGYMDNYTNAFPILKEFDMNATFFIISDFSISNKVDGSRFMSASEIKEMSDYGMDIQSHTVSHLELATLSYDEQLEELIDSKSTLEKLTAKPVTSIAYPLGSFNEDSKRACLNAGYSTSFTIDRGYADRDDSPFELNRICIDYTYSPINIEDVLSNLTK